jgi:hypothetical protein
MVFSFLKRQNCNRKPNKNRGNISNTTYINSSALLGLFTETVGVGKHITKAELPTRIGSDLKITVPRKSHSNYKGKSAY